MTKLKFIKLRQGLLCSYTLRLKHIRNNQRFLHFPKNTFNFFIIRNFLNIFFKFNSFEKYIFFIQLLFCFSISSTLCWFSFFIVFCYLKFITLLLKCNAMHKTTTHDIDFQQNDFNHRQTIYIHT